MTVVNDTCAILMLVRICPDMFRDDRYGCVMLPEAYREYTRSARFKRQYPWRSEYRGSLRSLPQTKLAEHGYVEVLKYMRASAERELDPSTGKAYADELSMTDVKMAAAAYSLDAELCSGDGPLSRFAEDQWEIGVLSPLALVNRWIEGGLIEWTDERQAVLEDWVRQERPQPRKDIAEFQRLTRRKYPR